MDEQQGAAGVGQRGDGALGMPGELLPDAFAEWDLGEFALLAQPGLDLGEGEGRARLGAADGLGEVGVAAALVADGGAADAGQSGDPGGGHLCRVVLHRRLPSLSQCDAEHTDARKIHAFTTVYTLGFVNRVDSVHSICSY